MSKLEWNLPKDQIFEAGLDRGVLYREEVPAVVWNGLTAVDDGGAATIKDFYMDGVKYLSTVSARDWKGSLKAFTYPDEFAELIGISELGDGLYADGQASDRFGLSYRTMITVPGVTTSQKYKIHLLYNVLAVLSPFSNTTLIGSGVNPNEFSFDLTAVPILVPNRRPTAHFIIDTRKVDENNLAELESIIYGDEDNEARLPTVEELIDLLHFTGDVIVVYNGDGTWTATGSNENIRMLDANGNFQIDNVDATYLTSDIYKFNGLDDGSGTFFMALDVDDDVPYAAEENVDGLVILTDTDGVYYYTTGAEGTGLGLYEDTDGTYYVD